MTLYNVHSNKSGYRINKFDSHLGYTTSHELEYKGRWGWSCTCPGGRRTTCRHRDMIILFLENGKVDSPEFFDFEKKIWVKDVISGTKVGDGW